MISYKSIFYPVAGIFLGSFLLSCGNSGSDSKKTDIDTVSVDTKKADSLNKAKQKAIAFKFQTTEANLPAPFEVINDVAGFQANFNKDLINPYNNVDKYVSSYKKAVNLGIYGIDLAYVNFYGQNQDMLHYFGSIQKLSKDLNFDNVFNTFADRFKNNSGNKDSVIHLADDAFSQTDDYLRKSDKILVSSHIMAGALIELNYLSLNLLKNTTKTAANDTFYEKIYNEKLYIYHLTNLFKEYTDADSKKLYAALDNYRTEYDNLVKSPADLTPENINKTLKLVEAIRNDLVK